MSKIEAHVFGGPWAGQVTKIDQVAVGIDVADLSDVPALTEPADGSTNAWVPPRFYYRRITHNGAPFLVPRDDAALIAAYEAGSGEGLEADVLTAEIERRGLDL